MDNVNLKGPETCANSTHELGYFAFDLPPKHSVMSLMPRAAQNDEVDHDVDDGGQRNEPIRVVPIPDSFDPRINSVG